MCLLQIKSLILPFFDLRRGKSLFGRERTTFAGPKTQVLQILCVCVCSIAIELRGSDVGGGGGRVLEFSTQ